MTCPLSLELAAFADGALAIEPAQHIEAHIRACEACRRTVALLRAENAALAAALDDESNLPVRPRLTAESLLRNLAAASALLYVPAWMLGRLPLLRFTVPVLEHLQLAFAATTVLLALSAAAFHLGWRRARAAALLTLLVLPAGARTFRAGEIVRMDGVTSEDVYVFARRLEVRGTVRGRLFAFAQEIEISGVVERGVYTLAESLQLAPGARVAEMLSAGEHTVVAGEISGALGFYGNRLRVEDVAQVRGAVSADVDNAALVHAPAGMRITIRDGSGRWRDPVHYANKLTAFIAALLAALVVSRIFPATFDGAVLALTRWWRSMAQGLAITVLAPAAVLLAAVTLIGLPLAALLVILLALAVYAAKLLTAELAGRLLLPGRSHVLQVACGLALVFAVIELPLGIGSAAWAAITVTGLGAFGASLRRALFRPREIRHKSG